MAGHPHFSSRPWLEPVPLLHLEVGRVDRTQALLAEPPVHLVEVLADDLLLGLRDAPPVWLAGVFKARVVGLPSTRRLSIAARPPTRRRRPGSRVRAPGAHGHLHAGLAHAARSTQCGPLAAAGPGVLSIHPDSPDYFTGCAAVERL
jgi:hypothetical protein